MNVGADMPIHAAAPVRPARRAPAWAVALGALLLLAGGCSRGSRLGDESNPFYLRGMRLRQESKYEEAAQAFEKCLRFSPTSVKAELQLAMLYEDHLGDPAQAIVHYQAYLRKAPKGENVDMVGKWLARAERTYLQQLMDRYPEDVDILVGRPDPGGSGIPARELALRDKVRRLQGEVDDLRGELSQVHNALAAARAGVNVPPQDTGPADGLPPAPHVLDEPLGPDPAPPAPPAGGNAGPGIARGPAVAPVPSPSPAPSAPAAGPLPPPPGGRDFVPVRRLSPGAAPLAPVGAAPATYTVQAGDTLSGVSAKVYGSSRYWPLIQEANRDRLKGGTALKPGMPLTIPPKPAALP